MSKVQRKLFGTNGIRGVPGEDLGLDFIAEMSQSIASFFSGKEAKEGGLAPTPAHQFAVRTLGYVGGIIVTASHNPPKYNGIKVVGRDGVEISRESEAEIESIYFGRSFKRAEWNSLGKSGKETRVVENYI